MWQSQRFMGAQQDRVLGEVLQWLDDHEELIMEFQVVFAQDTDGTPVYMVAYRTRHFEHGHFLT